MKKILFILLAVCSMSAFAQKVTTGVRTESSSIKVTNFEATFKPNKGEGTPFTVQAVGFSSKWLYQDQIITSPAYGKQPYYLKTVEFTYIDPKTKQPIERKCTPEDGNKYHIAHIQFFGTAKKNGVKFTITRKSKRIKLAIIGLDNSSHQIDMKNCENIT